MGKYRLEYWPGPGGGEIPTITDESFQQIFLDIVDGQACLIEGYPGEEDTYRVLRRFKSEQQADDVWDKLFDWIYRRNDVSLKRICQKVNMLMRKPRMAM